MQQRADLAQGPFPPPPPEAVASLDVRDIGTGMTVGQVTELVLPDVTIDDHVFGVAALSAEGHESLVAAYVVPTRPETTIQTRPPAK